jgi:hypothetical protein
MLTTSNKKNEGRDNNNTVRETIIVPGKIKLLNDSPFVLSRNNFMQQSVFSHSPE